METHLEKHHPEKNQHRFYALSINPNLFGGWSVIRRWGRIGSRTGGQKIDLYDDLESAQMGFKKKEKEKLRRDYRRV